MSVIKTFILTNFLFVFTLQSCNFSDSNKSLGNGYFYRNEGGEIKDILCKSANGGEVPSTVISYDFDDKFIIVKQKPKLPQDPLYNKDYEYDKGDDEFYYWLIVKKEDLVLGPLKFDEFIKQKYKYNVSDKLVFK